MLRGVRGALCERGGRSSYDLVPGEGVERLCGEGMARSDVAHAVRIEREVTYLHLALSRAHHGERSPSRGEPRRRRCDERPFDPGLLLRREGEQALAAKMGRRR